MNPHELRTRARMVQVWEEGHSRFPSELPARPGDGPDSHLTLMMYYASRLEYLGEYGSATSREWLWKLANTVSKMLPAGTDVLALALEEYSRSIKKHPGMTLECDGHTDATRLFALVEEIGEVSACLTYDNDSETGHGSDLESEVIQVVALALAWATRYLDSEEA